MMFLLRNLLLTCLLLSSTAQISWAAEAEKSEESTEKKAVSDSAFEKRQGLSIIDDENDQLAMESGHHDQIAVESGHRDQIAVESQNQNHNRNNGQTIPVPVPMRAVPANIIFPMPPGFGQGPPQGQHGPPPGHHVGPPPGHHGGPPPGHHGPGQHGPIVGLRVPPPPGKPQGFHQGPQGQFSQHQLNHQAPPPNFHQGPNFIPPQHQHQNQQQQQQIFQQQPPQPSPTQQNVIQQSTPASGEIVIQKAKVINTGEQFSGENQSGRSQNNQGKQQNQQFFQGGQGNSGEVRNQIQGHQTNQQHPSGLVPPPPHPRFPGPVRSEHAPPQKHGYSSAEITKNILRELFDRKPPGLKDGRPNGGFFAPPPQSGQGQSHPKVLNRPPNNNRPGRPAQQGGLFTHGKEVALSTNDLNAEGGEIGPGIQYGGPGPFAGNNADGPWPAGPDGDMPKIVSLEVKCEKNVMRVFVAFDKPFFGVIFSKGHYHNVNCIHLPAGLGHTSANFDIGIDTCGTQGNTENGLYGYGVQSGSGSYFENTVVIQYDSQVQEVWDQARKLRCTWHDQYEKSVTFRPFPVDMLDVVRADFAGDNVGCWMQIQVGKGPWASEVSGLVKIGQTMTMVLAIKDDDNKFDMMVRNCLAHDGQRSPIQLVDQWGCITRPKLMSPFTKIKNFGASATVLSYAHFQAFKFPDSMEVHFQCTIQICRHQCPEQCSQQGSGSGGDGYGVGKSGLPAPGDREESARRRRRAAAFNETGDDFEDEVFEYQTTFKADFSDDANKEDVGLNKVITVVSPDDLDFASNNGDSGEEGVPVVEASSSSDIVCMSTMGFAAMIVLLIGLLLIACIISAVIVIKKRPRSRKSF